MKKVSARRRRIPAFGEWNYDHGGYAYGFGGGGDWPVTQYFDAAMQAGLVVASLPPSPKPVKKVVKWSDRAALELELEMQQQQREHKLVVGLGDGKKQGKQSRVADAGANAAAAGYRATCRAVKAIDQDLYEIPPDMLCHKSRKRLTRRLWMGGCLGLGCVA